MEDKDRNQNWEQRAIVHVYFFPHAQRGGWWEAKQILKDHCWRIASCFIKFPKLPLDVTSTPANYLEGMPEKSISCHFATNVSAWSLLNATGTMFYCHWLFCNQHSRWVWHKKNTYTKNKQHVHYRSKVSCFPMSCKMNRKYSQDFDEVRNNDFYLK